MKPTASNTSYRLMTQLAQRLQLGRVLEATYGSGAMTADYKCASRKAIWSAAQLIALSDAKAFYN